MKYIVKWDGWAGGVEIENDFGGDPYVEAATRVFESIWDKKKEPTQLSVLAKCWREDKTPKKQKIVQVNVYHVLNNAGLCTSAEKVRDNCLRLHKLDLREEPIRSK